jgi:hypothetical protein
MNTMNPINTTARTPFAERIGRMLGRAWRGAQRQEENAGKWLMAQGMNAMLAQGILWALRLALLAVLLYGAFWVMLLLGSAVVATWASERYAPSGDFELQFPTLEELRQSPGYDPNFHDDTSHEMYYDD